MFDPHAPTRPLLGWWLAVAALVCLAWGADGWLFSLLCGVPRGAGICIATACASFPLVGALVRYDWTDKAQATWCAHALAGATGIWIVLILLALL